jgi:hypothetical protein
MASSYSSNLKLELMVTGEKSNLWGDITNTNLVILQQAIAGYEEISIAGGAQTTALTFSNGITSNGKNAVIKLTGTITGNQIVTIPDSIEKVYVIENGTSGAFTVTVKTISGTGVTWATTDKGKKMIYSDGTNILEGITSTGNITTGNITTGDITAGDITAGNISVGTIASGEITATGNIIPGATDTYDLGSASAVWRDIYTGDLHLSNQAKDQGNIVDGSKGSWTLQEGEKDVFLINNISGEKFKIKLDKI